MKIFALLAAGVAMAADTQTVQVIQDSGHNNNVQMYVEYYVEDGDLFLTQKLVRPTPTIWYRTTTMTTFVFSDPYNDEDWTDIAYSAIW